jgi:hypothetical protein
MTGWVGRRPARLGASVVCAVALVRAGALVGYVGGPAGAAGAAPGSASTGTAGVVSVLGANIQLLQRWKTKQSPPFLVPTVSRRLSDRPEDSRRHDLCVPSPARSDRASGEHRRTATLTMEAGVIGTLTNRGMGHGSPVMRLAQDPTAACDRLARAFRLAPRSEKFGCAVLHSHR